MDDIEPSWPSAFVRTEAGEVPLGRPWTARVLGGGTAYFAGIYFRYRNVDFDPTEHVAQDALDPRWPVSYDTFRPYYDEIEERIGIARLDSPGYREGETPPANLPPHAVSSAGHILATAGRSLGLTPLPTPLAINSVPRDGRPACVRCSPCNGYLCPNEAKADAPRIFLNEFDGADNFVRALGARAVRIELDRPDRARWIEWIDSTTRTRHRTAARLVVVAANAIQSSALLMRSTQRWAPAGLGNSSDMLGRGLSFKVSGSVAADIPLRGGHDGDPNGPHSTVAFLDYYRDRVCPTGLGGVLYETSPESGRRVDGQVRVVLHAVAADQPMHRNRVRLHASRDAWGVPRVGFDYQTHPIDRARLDYLLARASDVLDAAGAERIEYVPSGYEFGSRHIHGGCRAGVDEAESVLDDVGRLRDISNVYVVDGSYFPFAGGLNPTFTIQANALRIGRAAAGAL